MGSGIWYSIGNSPAHVCPAHSEEVKSGGVEYVVRFEFMARGKNRGFSREQKIPLKSRLDDVSTGEIDLPELCYKNFFKKYPMNTLLGRQWPHDLIRNQEIRMELQCEEKVETEKLEIISSPFTVACSGFSI